MVDKTVYSLSKRKSNCEWLLLVDVVISIPYVQMSFIERDFILSKCFLVHFYIWICELYFLKSFIDVRDYLCLRWIIIAISLKKWIVFKVSRSIEINDSWNIHKWFVRIKITMGCPLVMSNKAVSPERSERIYRSLASCIYNCVSSFLIS